jgi:hypothetical protein
MSEACNGAANAVDVILVEGMLYSIVRCQFLRRQARYTYEHQSKQAIGFAHDRVNIPRACRSRAQDNDDRIKLLQIAGEICTPCVIEITIYDEPMTSLSQRRREFSRRDPILRHVTNINSGHASPVPQQRQLSLY